MARKKYKQKYKSKREDFRKGGRVKAQVGGMQKAPISRRRPPIETTTEAKLIPGQFTDTRGGAGPTPPEGKLKQVDLNKITPNLNNLNSNKLLTEKELKALNASKPISKTQKELNIAQQKALQTQSNQEKRALELAQTGQQPARPSPRMEREAMNPATGKQYTPEEKRALDASIDQREFKRSVQPQERFIENIDTAANNIDTTFRQAPTTGKGSDQMFIGREGEVRPQANFDVQDRFRGRGRDERKDDPGTTTGPQIGDTKKGSGLVGKFLTYVWDGNNWVIKQKEDKEPVTEDEFAGMTDAQKQALFESERGERTITSGRTAEQLAAGEIPEGMIPTADVEKISMEGTEADTVQMGEAPTVDAVKVEPTAAEEVATMEAGLAKTPTTIDAATYDAVTVDQTPEVKAALGELSEGAKAKVVEINKLTDPATFASISQKIADDAKAEDIDGVLSSGAFLTEGGVRASDVNVSETPDAEAQTREAITGVPATDGQAAEIIGQIGYEAAKRRTVTGTAAKGAAASMIAEVGELPPEITAAIVEDPATMTAQVDENPVEVNAAIAALPTEALVSSQMESLLGGMEDGEVPMWARPAVDAINANMASRGLSVSTVGRDSLFNAIIQSALPMAQSNAQALQTRAAQNLGNLQQANLQQATQQQQLRLQNLANRQDAASQTAQMSQQMKTLQSQFNQQAVMTTAQQQQQTRTQNLQNRQQAAVLNTQNQQAMNAQNLGNEQQMELANLEIMNQTERENMTAENQERLAEMQVAADFLSKNAGFKQQMELANLSNDQQMRLANLSALNQAGSENLSAAQQTELANLNKTMQTNMLQANIAKDMGLAQLNVDQQTAIYNATTNANMDMANFNADQQRVLANSKFMQTVAITNMNAEQQSIMQNATAMASLDLATVDQRTKLAVTNAQNFLQMDMANLSNEQQASMMRSQQEQQRLLSNQSAENAAKQFNSASENQTNQFMASLESQMNQFNTAQLNAATQFNTQSQNAANARDANRTADVNKANASILNQVNQFNAQLDFNRQQWNSANEQAVLNSNVNWRRQSNMADTAAQNAVNQQNAQNAFGLTSAAQSFLWQELRDQADYDFRFAENSANRKLQAMIAAASSEGDAAKNWSNNFSSASSTIDRIFGTS